MTTVATSNAAKLATDRNYLLPPAPLYPAVTVGRAVLKGALADVSRAMAGKSALPILSTILMRVEQGSLTLTATDLTLVISRQIPAKSSEIWALCVPGKLLADIVSALPEGEVAIEQIGESIRVTVGNFETTIKGIEADEFPSLPSVEHATSVTLPAKAFADAIKATSFCAATDIGRPVLQGILVRIADQQATFSAADGFQLAKVQILLPETAQPVEEIIPAEALSAIAPLFAAFDQLTLTITSTVAVFAVDGVQAITRLIDGKYPDIERVIPKEGKIRATFKRSDIEQALKLASFFAVQASNIVRATLKPSGIILTANAAEMGDQKAEIEARVTGQEMQIAFNAKFAKEIIGAMGADEITLETASPQSPIVIRPVGSDDLYILMPMTIK